jgi:sugar phosphate isomerase/epimerase
VITRRVWAPTDREDERAVEVAEEAGAPLVVAHPPYRWHARSGAGWTSPRLMERTGVTVAVENMFPSTWR